MRAEETVEKEVDPRHKKLNELLFSLIANKFYGKLEVTFQHGEIVEVEERKKHKL
ncbi:MAG TPA: hypothetical protein PKM59_07235 [Thermodesulfobacteriota bacterium]|nr:hypothetical protein [Thermodesulfobacteriota bacterium]HNU70383.1 hypothetical protein [Thermodesulfobacteriota bacterium]